MRKPCSILLLCVLVVFGVTVVVPARDLPETAYDESEALPYLSTLVASLPAPKLLERPGEQAARILLQFLSFRGSAAWHIDPQVTVPALFCDSLTILNCAFRC